MSSTLTMTCPLCGLRFPGRALLELHLRDDHRERNRPAEPDLDDSRERGDGLASGQAGIADEEVIAMTTKQRSRAGQAMAALRRAIGILRSPARADKDA